MTKQGIQTLARKLLVVLMALGNISCAATPHAASSDDVADQSPKYAAVVHAEVAESRRELSRAAEARAEETLRSLAVIEPQPEQKVALRRLTNKETTAAHGIKAREILDSTRDLSFGSDIPFELEGRRYVARIEHHYHEPGGQATPWGWHRGISLFAVDTAS